MNSVKDINIKIRTFNLFDNMTNIKNLDPNNIKIDKKPLKKILIYYTGYVKPNRVKPLYHIINKVNGYIDEHNKNKYLALVYDDKNEDTLKKYGKLWKKNKILDQQVIGETIRMKNICKSYVR